VAVAAVAKPAPAAPPKPPSPPLDPDAAARLQDLKLAAERYKKFFRMRATEFLRGKGSLAVVSDPVCMGCTHCFDNCAFEAIDMVDRKFTLPELTYTSRKAVIIYENCVGCEKCAIVCPVDAITMVAKDGWEMKDGRLVQVEPQSLTPKPFLQPPKPGEPRPPGEAARFTLFREEDKKAPQKAAAPAAAPKLATPAPSAAPTTPPKPAPAAGTPPALAPTPPTPPAPVAPAKAPLTPEEIARLREEAKRKAEAAKAAKEAAETKEGA